ncbi:unnamed protein product [Coregonus sp. 'balchen']|nr:unnamed protein product [Coregonus sp. 'balchen']
MQRTYIKMDVLTFAIVNRPLAILNILANLFFAFLGYTLSTRMSTSVWQIFFYYTQIVPAQRALFIWVKRNIKIIIY